tara:strand:+ start:1195 stop:1440 length:246 start_codon:yes stop_codon:yes gene_type:complete
MTVGEFVDSRIGRAIFESMSDPEAAQRGFELGVPMARLAKMQDVTEAILFLASQRAQYLNGVILPVDDGKSAGHYQRPDYG